MLSHGGDKKQIHELIIEIVKVLSNIACRCNMRRKPKERIMLKILGLGNALVDVLTVLDSDDLLQRLSYPKGSMQLVGKEQSVELQNAIHDRERFFVTGGSASNTIAGLAKLGVSCGFIGKVGEDEEGSFFGRDMKSCGVEPFLIKSDLPTGVCVSLISPDSERTMITYLGAACELQSVDLKLSQFQGYDLFHIEGYLVQNYDLIETALKLAKEAGLKISLDLASYNVVEDNLEFLHRITSEYVDIIFANEEEAKSFTGLAPNEAADLLAEKYCEIAVVKKGEDGSIIRRGEEVYEILPLKGVEAVDTTGAGDLYASGFLCGYSNGHSLKYCGELGALVSGNIVQVVGTKMDEIRWNAIRAESCVD